MSAAPPSGATTAGATPDTADAVAAASDDAAGRTGRRRPLRRGALAALVGPYRKVLALGGACSVLNVLAGLAQPWPMQIVLDHVLGAPPGEDPAGVRAQERDAQHREEPGEQEAGRRPGERRERLVDLGPELDEVERAFGRGGTGGEERQGQGVGAVGRRPGEA